MDDHTPVHGAPTARQRVSGRSRAGRAPVSADRSTIAARRRPVRSPRAVRASQTAYEAGAPGTSVPVTPSRTPAARQPPRVAAANAARTEIALPAVWWWTAARTVAHGSMLVTGVSEPNARGTPWDANSANGLSRPASIGTRADGRTCRPRRPTARRNCGCTLAITPHAAELWRLLGRRPSPGARGGARSRATAGAPHRSTTPAERVDDRGHRGVADDVEARR